MDIQEQETFIRGLVVDDLVLTNYFTGSEVLNYLQILRITSTPNVINSTKRVIAKTQIVYNYYDGTATRGTWHIMASNPRATFRKLSSSEAESLIRIDRARRIEGTEARMVPAGAQWLI